MICPKCATQVDTLIAHQIEIIDGACESSCDDKVIIHVDCLCGFRLFAKTVDQPYATWAKDRYPAWVKISPFRPTNNDYDETLFIAAEGDALYLYQQQASIYGTCDQEPPDCDILGSELYVAENGDWHIWLPPLKLGIIVESEKCN